jgi:protein SCO1/2
MAVMKHDAQRPPVDRGRRALFSAALASACGAPFLAAQAAPEANAVQAPEGHAHHDHAAHLAAAAAPVQRTLVNYALPQVPVVDQRGRRGLLSEALGDSRVVILNFIYTSCTTVCPLSTKIFGGVQEQLAAELSRVHMVSVSIDPVYDTTERLADYARSYGAGVQWDFYTGTPQASIAIQRAFDAYRGDKMNHIPVTLLRGPRVGGWVRLSGLAPADAISDVYRSLAG